MRWPGMCYLSGGMMPEDFLANFTKEYFLSKVEQKERVVSVKGANLPMVWLTIDN